MCDWWFTESAVLIDTAGRYTTQDSDAAVDKAGWQAFLGLLRRTRARQPLNGVLVAIALSDIAAAPAAERLAHARAIRRRVKEVYDQLGVRVPVYALFTKADLIAGFTEFFDDLDRERRGPGLGRHLPAEQVRRRHRRPVRRRVRHVGRTAERAAARPTTGRTQPRPPHHDRRVPRPGREPRRAARRIPDRGVRRFPPGPCAGAARRLSDLRHPGRYADRSADRRNVAQLRHRRTARAVAAAGTGAQLLPQPAAEGGHLRRGDTRRARPRAGAPQRACPRRRRGGRAAGRAGRHGRAAADAAGEPGRGGSVTGRTRCLCQVGAVGSARSGRRAAARQDRPAARSGARLAVWRRRPIVLIPVVPRPVADRQTRRRRSRGLSPRPAAHPAAGADRPAGGPDARAFRAAGLPLRGDACLSDARLRRTA